MTEENGRVEGESRCPVAELPDDIAHEIATFGGITHEIESFGEDVTCPICHALLVGLNLSKKKFTPLCSHLSKHQILSIYLYIYFYKVNYCY